MNNSHFKFALFDGFSRTILAIVADRNLAHKLQSVFYGKSALLIANITNFQNYSPDQINNSNCQEWSMPCVAKPFEKRISLVYPTVHQILMSDDFEQDRLIHCCFSTMPTERILDLQQQIQFAETILNFSEFELSLERNHNSELDSIIQQLLEICQCELTFDAVKQQASDLALKHVKTNSGLMAHILNITQRLYD